MFTRRIHVTIKAFRVDNHFLYSLDINEKFSSIIVRRNQMLVTLRRQWDSQWKQLVLDFLSDTLLMSDCFWQQFPFFFRLKSYLLVSTQFITFQNWEKSTQQRHFMITSRRSHATVNENNKLKCLSGCANRVLAKGKCNYRPCAFGIYVAGGWASW